MSISKTDMTSERRARLAGLLARAYPYQEEIRELVHRTTIRPEHVEWKERASSTWYALINEAFNQKRLDDLVQSVLADERRRAFHQGLKDFFEGLPDDVSQPPVQEVGEVPGSSRLEKWMEERPKYVDVAFLERGVSCARSVVMVQGVFEAGIISGTGFVFDDNAVLTARHNVIHKGEKARTIEVVYDYFVELSGRVNQGIRKRADTESLRHNAALDCAVIQVDTGSRGALERSSRNIRRGDWVVIVQHPQGLPKKIGVADNLVSFVNDDIIQYCVDTFGGSSGSPVFDSDWKVVGLHRAGGELPRGSSERFFVNEGVRLGRVREWWLQAES